jgi:hypothetical protein
MLIVRYRIVNRYFLGLDGLVVMLFGGTHSAPKLTPTAALLAGVAVGLVGLGRVCGEIHPDSPSLGPMVV